MLLDEVGCLLLYFYCVECLFHFILESNEIFLYIVRYNKTVARSPFPRFSRFPRRNRDRDKEPLRLVFFFFFLFLVVEKQATLKTCENCKLCAYNSALLIYLFNSILLICLFVERRHKAHGTRHALLNDLIPILFMLLYCVKILDFLFVDFSVCRILYLAALQLTAFSVCANGR